MRNDWEKEIAAYYRDEVRRIIVPDLPARLRSESVPRDRLRPMDARAELFGLAMAAAVAAFCILGPVGRGSAPVSRGAALLFSDSGLRDAAVGSLLDAARMLGASISKE